MIASTWFHANTKGTAAAVFWSRVRRPLLVLGLRFRGRLPLAPPAREGAAAAQSLGGGADQFLQLAAFEHLHHDVRPADEFPLHIELGNGRPVRIFLNAL